MGHVSCGSHDPDITATNPEFPMLPMMTGRPSTRTVRRVLPLLVALLVAPAMAAAQNAIVLENRKSGTPQSTWDISGAGDLTIQGFATDISVNKGSTVRFKVKTNASLYHIDVYRLGYYAGNGARKVGTGAVTASLPQSQPADLYDAATGLTDCGNWSESAHGVISREGKSCASFITRPHARRLQVEVRQLIRHPPPHLG